ncbi:2'-5' RNA ligase family protein [Kocuria massiliensis]|uniref:2'-5' RNA ligase family protein n=1 Tax=Kocuria massiliensis TaxID=1926282 RepID=UPI000A1CE403|nr:2'-5' RNA ligase family protein [Kocuria massiliensis]
MGASESPLSRAVSVSPTILPGKSYLSLILEVPDDVQDAVMNWRRQHGAAEGYPPHITVFISELGEKPYVEANRFLREMRSELRGRGPAEIALSGTGTFRPISDVVYLALARGSDFLNHLHEQCRRIRNSASPFMFHPHMTIVQNERRRLLEAAFRTFDAFEAHFTVHRACAFLSDEEGWTHLGNISFD